jgi:hypothetical protein
MAHSTIHQVGSSDSDGELESIDNISPLESMLENVRLEDKSTYVGILNVNTGDGSVEVKESTGIDPIELSLNSQEDMRVAQKKAARKQAKKEAKEARRAKREGRADVTYGQKPCDLCERSVDLLIRCQVDASGQWKMVCGKCWHTVSGGVVDGDVHHPYYRYGGLWKNRKRK